MFDVCSQYRAFICDGKLFNCMYDGDNDRRYFIHILDMDVIFE
jgi:hypothetical protein